eukprot:scaffold31542_cov49-Attheya_sp.AAC.3
MGTTSDEKEACFAEGAAAQKASVHDVNASISSGPANINMQRNETMLDAPPPVTTTTTTTTTATSSSTTTPLAADQVTVAVDLGSTVAPPAAVAAQSSQESSSDQYQLQRQTTTTSSSSSSSGRIKRTPMDVLSLKGSGVGISPGNTLFRAYVAANKKDFANATVEGRLLMVQYIADNLAKVGARFLKRKKGTIKDKDKNYPIENDLDQVVWEAMGPLAATAKIRSALRDFHEKMVPHVFARTNIRDASTAFNQAQSPNGFLNMDTADWSTQLAPLLTSQCERQRPFRPKVKVKVNNRSNVSSPSMMGPIVPSSPSPSPSPSIKGLPVVPSTPSTTPTPTPTTTPNKTTLKRKNANNTTSPFVLANSPVILNSKRQRRVTQKITDNVESTGTLYNAIPAENLRPDAVRHNKNTSNKSSPSPKKKKAHSSPSASPISVAKTKDRQRTTQHVSGKHPTIIMTTAAAAAAAKSVSAAAALQSAVKQALELPSNKNTNAQPKMLTSQRSPPPSSSSTKKSKKQQNVPNKKNVKKTNSSGNASNNATLSELMKKASKHLHPYARVLIQQMLVSKDVQGALAILNREQVASQRPDATNSESEREKRIRNQARIDPKLFMERLLHCMSDGNNALQISVVPDAPTAVVNSK